MFSLNYNININESIQCDAMSFAALALPAQPSAIRSAYIFCKLKRHDSFRFTFEVFMLVVYSVLSLPQSFFSRRIYFVRKTTQIHNIFIFIFKSDKRSNRNNKNECVTMSTCPICAKNQLRRSDKGFFLFIFSLSVAVIFDFFLCVTARIKMQEINVHSGNGI